MSRRNKGRPVSGWLCLDKAVGLTSTGAVGSIKRLFGAAKVGHAGTLDPLASGVLPIALGDATAPSLSSRTAARSIASPCAGARKPTPTTPMAP